jgi:osmotically inducible protein OsmC
VTILYQTQATAIGGRTGSAASADGMLRLALATPRELGGPGGNGTNPEQLFAAGYAASFLATLRLIGTKSIAEDANVTATIGIGPCSDGNGMALDIALDVDLPGLEEAEAWRIVRQAHGICPYSTAIHGNVNVRTTIQ